MFTPLDDPAEALAHLASPLRVLRDCLEDGGSFADSTLEERPYDPHMWAHLTRYHARNELYAAEKEATNWSMGRKLANSGIEIVCDPLVVRVLKTQGSTTPHPGSNSARMNFWSQAVAVTQMRLPLLFGSKSMPHAANVIVDWTIGTDKEILLALAKPVGTWKYRHNPKLQWRRPVVFDAADEPRFIPRDEDVDVRYDADELKGEREVE